MSGKGDYKTISRVADFVQVCGIFTLCLALFPVFIFVGSAFGDDPEAFARAYQSDQLFHSGVLLALGGIAIGVGRILQVLENRNE